MKYYTAILMFLTVQCWGQSNAVLPIVEFSQEVPNTKDLLKLLGINYWKISIKPQNDENILHCKMRYYERDAEGRVSAKEVWSIASIGVRAGGAYNICVFQNRSEVSIMLGNTETVSINNEESFILSDPYQFVKRINIPQILGLSDKFILERFPSYKSLGKIGDVQLGKNEYVLLVDFYEKRTHPRKRIISTNWNI